MLESRQTVIKKKIADELAKAQECVRRKDKRGALKVSAPTTAHNHCQSAGPPHSLLPPAQCLKLKQLYEKNLEQLENQQLNLENQINVIESAKTAAEVANAMALSGAALKHLSKTTSVEAVDKVMDDIQEATDRMAEVQNALAQPVTGGEILDEDALDAELAELEALDTDAELLGEALPTAPKALPVAPPRVPAVAMPAAGGRGGVERASALTPEEEELEALQAEMAM
jgi:charged multivesicular body protein 4